MINNCVLWKCHSHTPEGTKTALLNKGQHNPNSIHYNAMVFAVEFFVRTVYWQPVAVEFEYVLFTGFSLLSLIVLVIISL